MSTRLHSARALAASALIALTGCAGLGSVKPSTVTAVEFTVCPQAEPKEACHNWPTGANTLREQLILSEKQHLAWQQCQAAYQALVSDISRCREAHKQLEREK